MFHQTIINVYTAWLIFSKLHSRLKIVLLFPYWTWLTLEKCRQSVLKQLLPILVNQYNGMCKKFHHFNIQGVCGVCDNLNVSTRRCLDTSVYSVRGALFPVEWDIWAPLLTEILRLQQGRSSSSSNMMSHSSSHCLQHSMILWQCHTVTGSVYWTTLKLGT